MTDPVLDLAPRGSISIDCVVNGPISTNTYFVVSGDEALIIDPAWEGDKLAERLRAAHPGARPVGIVCTHGHGDHVGGVAGMRRALGDDVPYLISASDAGFVRDAVASMRVRWGIDTEMPPAPDRLLSEGDTVAVGDAVLQVIDAPGHTPGGIVLFCASAEGRHPVPRRPRPHRPGRRRRGHDPAHAWPPVPVPAGGHAVPHRARRDHDRLRRA